MSAAVEMIVDREDDIATVRAIRALAAREPGVLAVSIVPGVRSETEVIWEILRALGNGSASSRPTSRSGGSTPSGG